VQRSKVQPLREQLDIKLKDVLRRFFSSCRAQSVRTAFKRCSVDVLIFSCRASGARRHGEIDGFLRFVVALVGSSLSGVIVASG